MENNLNNLNIIMCTCIALRNGIHSNSNILMNLRDITFVMYISSRKVRWKIYENVLWYRDIHRGIVKNIRYGEAKIIFLGGRVFLQRFWLEIKRLLTFFIMITKKTNILILIQILKHYLKKFTVATLISVTCISLSSRFVIFLN